MIIKVIENRDEKLINSLVPLWERSVKASHKFLSLKEIEEIKKYVFIALKEVPTLIVAFDETNNNLPLGFIGLTDKKIEMLFIDSIYFSKGIGSKLIEFAFNKFKVNEVVVNKDNINAYNFYLKKGFKDYKYSEVDEQGNPYPIIFMKKDN